MKREKLKMIKKKMEMPSNNIKKNQKKKEIWLIKMIVKAYLKNSNKNKKK